MTREEREWAIEILKEDSCVDCSCANMSYAKCTYEGHCDIRTAMNMAIAALKAEPCGDAVSREALLEKLEEWDWQDLYLPVHFKELVDDLPSVTPKQRTGKWILVRNKLGATIDRICSCCNRSHEKTSDFCPNCGAKMEGESDG